MEGTGHKRRKTGLFSGDLEHDTQDDARWNGIMSRFKSRKTAPVPVPKKMFRRSTLLDDINIFIKDREKRRNEHMKTMDTSFFGSNDGNATFYGNNTTIPSEVGEADVFKLSDFRDEIKVRDAATMTTFEPSFLQSLGSPIFKNTENGTQDVDFVPDSQVPVADISRMFGGPDPFQDPIDDSLSEMDFMRDLNATFEKTKSAPRTPIILQLQSQPTPVPTPKPKWVNVEGDRKRRNDNFDGMGDKAVAVKSIVEAKPVVVGFKGMVCEVTTALESKERPYVKSLIGDVVSRQAKFAHQLLFGGTDDDDSNATSATNDFIADVLGGLEKKKKRKTNIICGVDVSKHPQPVLPMDSSTSLASQSFTLPKDDGGALFPTPRLPKPVSPGSKRLRKQLGFAVPDLPKAKKPKQNTPTIGTPKRSIAEAYKDVRR